MENPIYVHIDGYANINSDSVLILEHNMALCMSTDDGAMIITEANALCGFWKEKRLVYDGETVSCEFALSSDQVADIRGALGDTIHEWFSRELERIERTT